MDNNPHLSRLYPTPSPDILELAKDTRKATSSRHSPYPSRSSAFSARTLQKMLQESRNICDTTNSQVLALKQRMLALRQHQNYIELQKKAFDQELKYTQWVMAELYHDLRDLETKEDSEQMTLGWAVRGVTAGHVSPDDDGPTPFIPPAGFFETLESSVAAALRPRPTTSFEGLDEESELFISDPETSERSDSPMESPNTITS